MESADPRVLLVHTETERIIAAGYTIYAPTEETVQTAGIVCGGFFSEWRKLLAYAAGKPFDKWFPVFVHESCHFDQCVEQAEVWTKIHGSDPTFIVDLWLNRIVEMNAIQLDFAIDKALQIELDCEKRSLAKYTKYNIPIDQARHIQRANAYIYFFLYLKHSREWYRVSPRSIDTIVSLMPTTFDNDYTQLQPQWLQAFELCYPSKLPGWSVVL